MLEFCEQIRRGTSPNYILTVEAVYQLFNLTLNIYRKNQKNTKKFIDFITRECFSKPFFETQVKLRDNKISSFDIFKLLWVKPPAFDSAFLKLIELLQSNKWLTEDDILQLSKFAQNAQYIYNGLIFLKDYKLNTIDNIKALFEQAEFAETLSNAWYYFVDNEFPFHETISIPIEVKNIIIVMLQNPRDALRLAMGIVILYQNNLFFKYSTILCKHPAHAPELAKAFVTVIKMPTYYEEIVATIEQYPEHADEIARAINILTTNRTHGYYMMLHSNPRQATVIAKLVTILHNKDLINIDVRAAIVNNARHLMDLFNIVVMLQRLSTMLNVKTLYVIIDNADFIPQIHDKLMGMPVVEFNVLNLVGLNKLIDEIKSEKGKKELEKVQQREKKLEIEPIAAVSPLAEIQGIHGAMHYLDDNIFLLKTSINKHVAINHIKKVYVQLLQHGMNSKEERILQAMCDLFSYINRGEHKIRINTHKNRRYDSLFSKNNTNAWTDMMKVIRDQAYQLLMELVDKEPDTNKKIALLEKMSAQAIFVEHRTNSFFNRFHDTKTVNAINQKIASLISPVEPALIK